ncbi:alcohol dehydrogenase catalytic domain-containing protein, partial [Pseudomonas syringae]
MIFVALRACQFTHPITAVCHSDIHQARNEWGIAVYPLMPGHEIVGRVTATGANATRYKVGDLVGVGCMV